MKTKAELLKTEHLVSPSVFFPKPTKQTKWIYHVELKREKSAEKFCQKLEAFTRN